MKKYSFWAWGLTLALLLSGCGGENSVPSAGTEASSAPSATTQPSTGNSTSVDTTDIFSNRDFDTEYSEAKSAAITLNGSSASCSSNAVQISGSTITITDEGTYILSGTLDNGMIIVNTEKDKKTQLVLDGVTIHSESSAAIYVLQSDKVFITTAEGSVNTLSNSGIYTAIDENNIDAVIYSKEDLTLNGSGTLAISSPGGHGIVSKDSLTITGGSYDITCSSHGMTGKDNVAIANAAITISAGKDGIQSENEDDASLGYVFIQSGTLTISAEGDGISAQSYLYIEDGTFDIVSGGGSANGASYSSDAWGNFGGMGGMGRPGGNSGSSTNEQDSTSIKGIKADGDITILGGTFSINSADDAVHSNASLTIHGGIFSVASGDDAFHAEDTLTVNAGTIDISESYEGLEALHISVTGGDITLVASDDGLNAAGGTDSSGMGGRDNMFGNRGGMGGMGGMSSSSNGSITISGGTLSITASGDGIDANGSLTISGGFTTVCGPTQGDTATLDYDTTAVITGGTFIGTGASTMAQTFSDSEQGVIAVSISNQAAGTLITLTDSAGNVVVEYAPPLSFGVIILSTPDMVSGENYTITVGSATGTFAAS